MDLKGKKVFITGAGGFIGSHLVEEVIKTGAMVTALIHYNSRNNFGNLELLKKNILKEVKVVSGDVCDPFFLLRATKEQDVIFHLAALIPIPYSYIAPQSFVQTNINGTLNILETVRINNISKVIITSTSETYGTAVYAPIDEKHPLQGQSPYSASKIGADKIAESYYLSFNLPVVIVRPFNTFGPRQSARAVIPSIISQSLSQPKIRVGSLSPVRDFTYVKDTVRGFIKAAESEKSVGELINLGTGVGATINEVKNKIENILGKKIEVEEDSARIRPGKSEVLKLICDNKKAKELLGWEPSYTLDEGLKEVVDFISKNLSLYKTEIYNV